MTNEGREVVVIGAGVVGTAVAYYLSKEGVKVTVLDGNAIGSGASFHGVGNIGMVNWKDRHHFQFGLAAKEVLLDLVPELTEETGIETYLQKLHEVEMALDEDEIPAIEPTINMAQEFVPIEWISGEEILKLEPRLNPGIIKGISYEVHQIDGYPLSLAYAQAAEKRGAEFLTREVTGLERSGSRVTGVVHRSGTIPCDRVVVAMGAWSGGVSSWLDFQVPVQPLKGELLHLQFDGKPPAISIYSPKRGHILSRKDGTVGIGSTGNRWHFDQPDDIVKEFESTPTEAARQELTQRAIVLMPCLESARVLRALAGPRPLPADGLPIIGPVPDWEGVYLATGHRNKGIHLSALTGRIVASWILRGSPESPVAVGPFLPERFLSLGCSLTTTPERGEEGALGDD